MNRIAQEWQKLRTSALARNAGWMMFGQCFGYVLQAAYFIILARLLGVLQYGIFAGAFAFVALVAQYSPLGSGTLFIRYVSVDRSKFALYWGNMLLVTTSVGLLLVFILHLTGKHFLNPASAALVLMAALSNCLGTQIASCVAQIFQTIGQMRITAMFNMLISTLRVITASVMLVVMHHATAWQWAIAVTSVSIIGAVLSIGIVIVRFERPKISLDIFFKHAVEGLEYSFATSTAAAYNDLDKTMLSHYGMNAANGIYTMAYRVVDIASMPIFSLLAAAVPKLFQKGHEGIREVAEFAWKLWRRAFLFSLVAALGMFLTAPLIPKLTGKGFTEAVSALRWLCLIPVFRSIHQMAGSALMGAGLQRYRTLAQVIAAAVNFCLNLWLIPAHGWLGAAWASLLTDCLLSIMNTGSLTVLCARAKKVVGSSPTQLHS